MPLYLTRLVPGERGKHPAGTEGLAPDVCNWLYFRLEDRALVWSAVPLVHAQATLIADDVDEPLTTPAARAALANFVGDRTFTGSQRWREALIDMLRRPPPKWRGLQPTQMGDYHLWFGPGGRGNNLLYAEVTAPRHASKDLQDSFDRADGNLNGSTSSDAQFTWSETIGTAWTITSNAAQTTGNVGFVTAMGSLDLDTVDSYTEGVIGTWTHGSGAANLGLLARLRFGTTAAGDEGYGFEVTQSAGNSRRTYDFFSDVDLASDTTLTNAGTLRLEVNGSTITAKVNGATVLGPTTDPSPYTTYKRPGITSYNTGTNTVTFVSFRAADLVAAGRTTKNLRSHPLGLGLGLGLGIGGTS